MSSLGNKLGKGLLVVAMGFSLTACNEFEGNVNVSETLRLNVMKGNSTVAPGVYGIKIKPEQERIRLEIKIEGKNNNPVANFKIKPGDLPSWSGGFRLLPESTGQPYLVDGELTTDVQEGPIHMEYRSCSIPKTVRECTINDKGKRVCKNRTTYLSGDKEVHYHSRSERQTLRLALVDSVNGSIVATGDGDHFDSDTIIDYEGPCYLR